MAWMRERLQGDRGHCFGYLFSSFLATAAGPPHLFGYLVLTFPAHLVFSQGTERETTCETSKTNVKKGEGQGKKVRLHRR